MNNLSAAVPGDITGQYVATWLNWLNGGALLLNEATPVKPVTMVGASYSTSNAFSASSCGRRCTESEVRLSRSAGGVVATSASSSSPASRVASSSINRRRS